MNRNDEAHNDFSHRGLGFKNGPIVTGFFTGAQSFLFGAKGLNLFDGL